MKMHNSHEQFRSYIVFFIIIFLYAVIVFNLYLLQIKQQSFFLDLARKQYNVSLTTYPKRAEIYDRNNTPLAINKDSYAAFVIPKEMKFPDETKKFLEQNFPLAASKLSQQGNQNFMFIARRLTDEEKSLLDEANIPDIHLLQEPSRFYPYKAMSTIVGMTDIDNKGCLGIEQQYNSQLSGTPTQHTLKKDARSNHFYFEKEIAEEGVASQPVQLTIDADLQLKLYEMLEDTIEKFEAKEAALVVMNPDNGDIDAMVSYPCFDANHTSNLDIEKTKNRPVSQAFETGSVIKVFSALAALEEELTTLDEPIDCENTKETKVNGIRVRTVIPAGTIPFLEVIQKSNNIGTTKVVSRLGDLLYDYYTLVGFGIPTHLGFPGEQKGYVNHPSNWSAYSIYSLSYGYELTTTLLQLARAMSLVVNGGHLVEPRLLKDAPIKKSEQFISTETLEDLQKILQASVEKGTGRRAKIQGYKIIGKTGTSNMIENGQYNEQKNLYTFIGAVEKDNYKRVIVAYIKESKKKTYSAVIAAPIFRKAAEATLLHDHIII